jgi:hypothetical protein
MNIFESSSHIKSDYYMNCTGSLATIEKMNEPEWNAEIKLKHLTDIRQKAYKPTSMICFFSNLLLTFATHTAYKIYIVMNLFSLT